MRRWTTVFFLAAASLPVLGCRPAPADVTTPPVQPEPRRETAPVAAGRIEGRVVWQGSPPVVEPLVVRWPSRPNRREPNPFGPRISATGGMGQILVFLEHVPAGDHSWKLDPVEVELQGERMRIRQGSRTGPIGIVRKGEAIRLINRDREFQSVRLRGAEFASLPLVEPDRPTFRTLHRPGLVALSSGNGRFWQGAHLYVADHPFCTLTDEEGRFVLEGVPAGKTRLVCLVPHWRVAEVQDNPEWRIVHGLVYAPPVRKVRDVEVAPEGSTAVDFVFSAQEFAGPPSR